MTISLALGPRFHWQSIPVARRASAVWMECFSIPPLEAWRSNLIAIDTGDQKEAGEEYSKGSFHTPFPTANFSVYHTLAV